MTNVAEPTGRVIGIEIPARAAAIDLERAADPRTQLACADAQRPFRLIAA